MGHTYYWRREKIVELKKIRLMEVLPCHYYLQWLLFFYLLSNIWLRDNRFFCGVIDFLFDVI